MAAYLSLTWQVLVLSADLLTTYVVPSLEYLLRDMDDLKPDRAVSY